MGAFDGGSPSLDYLTTDSAGETSVSMSTRLRADELPDPIARLRLPSLDIVQRERWYLAEGGTLRGEITVDALRTPISGRGSIDLTSAGSGTRLAGTATVNVNVPLIGRPISRFVAGLLARGILDIVHVTDSWLAQNPEPTPRRRPHGQ